jgi:hypothetical protein
MLHNSKPFLYIPLQNTQKPLPLHAAFIVLLIYDVGRL